MEYQIKMKSSDFFKVYNKLKIYNMEIENDQVIFKVDIKNYKMLKTYKYDFEIIESSNKKIKSLFKKNKLLLLGVVFSMSILYIDSYRVSGIVFNSETPINAEIEEYIKSFNRKLTIFDYSNIDFIKLSNELRQKYANYPYINVYKQNDIIKVEIYDYNDKINIENYYTSIGNIVAKKESVVDVFYVYNGSLNVYKNKYVKKGDVLISSNINNNLYVSAKGLILGYTYEKISIKVPKEEKIYIDSGLYDEYINISFLSFNFNINKHNQYINIDRKINEVFNLFGIFFIKKIVDIEKNDIIKTYSKEEAIELANKQIDDDFIQNKTSSFERIIDRCLYQVIDNDHYYTIEIILKKYESIGVFVEIDK